MATPRTTPYNRPPMHGTLRVRDVLRWTMVGTVVPLLLSCSRPAEHASPPCTISVGVGESIQAVLDSAPPGAVICLPVGTWTENLHVTKPVTLRGAGPEKTTVRSGAFASPVVTVGPRVEPEQPVVLVGIAFTEASGSCSDPVGCAHGLLVTGSAVVQATRCSFAGNSAAGVSVRDVARAELQDCSIVNNTWYGLAVQGRGQATLTSVTLSRSRSMGVWLADEAHLILVRSTVTDCDDHGLWIRDRSTLTATDSTLSSCTGHGLWARDEASADLSGCTITGHRDAGVRATQDARVSLASCTVELNWTGVEARDRASVRIENSTLSTPRWDGIKLLGSARGIILGSTLSGGRGSGIHLGGAAQAEISGNRIVSWAAYGVLGLSQVQPRGEGNQLADNGVDLSGNVPGALRAPLHPPIHDEVRFPDPRYASVQAALDAVAPGGRLVLTEGIHTGGLTIGKPVRIKAEGVVLLTARSQGESPILSLVGGADLLLDGVALGYGSEGLVLGADARALLTHCVVSDNSRGVHAANEAEIVLLESRLSRNTQGGLWLGDRSRADVRDCTFTANAVWAIVVSASAEATISGCVITESGWAAGIAVRDAAQAHIEGNTIVANHGLGVALYHGTCIGVRQVFTGRVTGGGNVLHSNRKGDVCPDGLSFLTLSWGELDFRR